MKIFNAADFGIVPNEDISEKLAEFISALKDEDGEKTAVFDSGTYYIDSERCKEYMLVITNTAGEKEFSPDETPHLNAVPFYFGGISNLVFDGGDSVFVIDGKVTNIAVEDCRNITLRNLEIRHAHPDMHEFSVVRKSAFSVDFKIDSDSSFSVENGKLVFSGHGYKNCCDMSSVNAGWIGLIREKTPEKVKRVMHPLLSSLGEREQLVGEELWWYPAEMDIPVTYFGWFWRPLFEIFFTRTVSNLTKCYYNSVGGNAMLLVNIPPNNRGELPDRFINRLVKARKRIEKCF